MSSGSQASFQGFSDRLPNPRYFDIDCVTFDDRAMRRNQMKNPGAHNNALSSAT
jgi:hypothetical protein